MPAPKKDIKIERSRPEKKVTGIIEENMPFVREDFDSDMEFKFASQAFNDIKSQGRNFITVMPQIMVYAKCLSVYFSIMGEVGTNYAVPTERAGLKSNPKIKIALEFLDRARQWSRMLGVDLYTRGNMPNAIPKLPGDNKDLPGSKFLKEL